MLIQPVQGCLFIILLNYVVLDKNILCYGT